MSVYTGNLRLKNSPAKDKLPGWAAFDLRQQKGKGIGHEEAKDPYPPMSTNKSLISSAGKDFGKNRLNNDVSERPFASVILPSIQFPSLAQNKTLIRFEDSSENQGNKAVARNRDSVFEMLKELHSWADDSLINDVMIGLDNDFNKASILLKGMATSESELNLTADHDSADPSSTLDGENFGHVLDFCRGRISTDAALGHDLESVTRILNSIPAEPEWEEDDVYLSHRKDALKMMRSAAYHSRAATNAFMKGNHMVAHQHSSKARESWSAAERLNSEAAKQILRIRNNPNDIWKLDLHGLHADEAVQALKDHLRRIELKMLTNHSAVPNEDNVQNGGVEQHRTIRVQRPMYVQVVTGIGNHSRGHAALPTAIENFLSDNGYRFVEPRAGVISVQPKFRYG